MTIEDVQVEIEYVDKAKVRLGDVAYVGMFFQVKGTLYQVMQLGYSANKYVRCVEYDPDKPGPYNFSPNILIEPAVAVKIIATFER